MGQSFILTLTRDDGESNDIDFSPEMLQTQEGREQLINGINDALREIEETEYSPDASIAFERLGESLLRGIHPDEIG